MAGTEGASATTADVAPTMPMESIAELLKLLTSAIAAMGSGNIPVGTAPETKTEEERSTSPKLDIRNFMKMEKFSGGEMEWKEWSFDLKVLVVSINPDLERWFENIEALNVPVLTPELLNQTYQDTGNGTKKPKDLEKRSKELFGILCAFTSGDAKTLIRGQTDGLAAYHVLHKTYSRRTLTKEIRTIRDALVPKKAATIDEVIIRISEWETHLAELQKTDQTLILKPLFKVALLTEICPGEIRDLISRTSMRKKSCLTCTRPSEEW